MIELDPQSRELVIRTVLGEAANEPDDGMAAVAAVIRNRAASGRFGKTVPDVVLARHQFEPWSTPAGRNRMMGYAADGEAYQRAARAVDAVFGQGLDPTSGATHFFSPTAQAALGREVPSWASGEGQAIGRHTFYAPKGRVRMASSEVTDADVLARFNQSRGQEVSDPEVLRRFGSVSVKPTRSTAQAALEPITSYPETYSEMNREAREQVSRGVDQISGAVSGEGDFGDRAIEAAKGVGNVVLGGAGYVASPVNAALRTVVGRPVEQATGVPKEITEFATSFMLPGMGVTRAGALRPRPLPARPVPSAGEEAVMAAENVAQTSGVPINIPRSVASDNIVTNQAGRTVANIPVVGAPLRRSSTELIENVDTAATNLRAGFGSGDMALAGGMAREGLEESIKSGPFKRKVTDLYNRVDHYVNPVTIAPMSNTRAIRDTISARRRNAALPDSKLADGLEEALNRPGMNYEGIKSLRTYYGEMKDGNVPIPVGITQNEVNQIYGALTKDMRLIIAKAGGPEGLKAWEKANREAARWADVRNTLMPLLKVKNDEGIVDRLRAAASSSSRADMKLLTRARGAVGAHRWDEISSAIIERMIHRPGKDGFSFDTFATEYGKLSDHGKQILFRSTHHMPHADAIDDIAKISARIKSHNQYANPSGTGQTVATFSGGLGVAIDPISTIGTLVGGNVLARILAKPATARSMAAWSRAYQRAVMQNTPAARQGYENASRLFAGSIGTELSRSDVIPTLTSQLQGVMPTHADQE